MRTQREWILRFDNIRLDGWIMYGPCDLSHSEQEDVPVIEKSAYDELAKERNQWRHWSLMLESQLNGHSMPGYTNSRALAEFAEFKKKMDATEGDE